MHLDRDDLGDKNDKIYLPDGSMIKVPQNQELLTIRGIVPGEYVLNIHMYSSTTIPMYIYSRTKTKVSGVV